MSLTVFKAILKQKNIETWQPKKDQCDTRIAYKQCNVSEETYMGHIDMKNKARQEKTNDKDEAAKSANKILMLTVDMQAVQNIPKLQAALLQNKVKIAQLYDLQ